MLGERRGRGRNGKVILFKSIKQNVTNANKTRHDMTSIHYSFYFKNLNQQIQFHLYQILGNSNQVIMILVLELLVE